MRHFKNNWIAMLALSWLTGCQQPVDNQIDEAAAETVRPESQVSAAPTQTPPADPYIFLHCSYIPNGQGSYSIYEAEFRVDPENGKLGTYDGSSNAYQDGIFPSYGTAGTDAYTISWTSEMIADVGDQYIKIYRRGKEYRYYEINRSTGYLTFYTGRTLGVCQRSTSQVKNRSF